MHRQVEDGKTLTADWRNKKYLDFLKAGGSNYSLEILKQAGVDITTDKPYQMAFQHFNQLVSEMETIVYRLKKNKKL